MNGWLWVVAVVIVAAALIVAALCVTLVRAMADKRAADAEIARRAQRKECQ